MIFSSFKINHATGITFDDAHYYSFEETSDVIFIQRSIDIGL